MFWFTARLFISLNRVYSFLSGDLFNSTSKTGLCGQSCVRSFRGLFVKSSRTLRVSGMVGGGGGGHCLFECRYLVPNYHSCFLVLSAPQFFFRPSPIFQTHRLPHAKVLNRKLSTKVIQFSCPSEYPLPLPGYEIALSRQWVWPCPAKKIHRN